MAPLRTWDAGCVGYSSGKGPAAQEGADSALAARNRERLESAQRAFRVGVFAGLEMHAHEQARSLTLGERRDPWGRDRERVGTRIQLQPAAAGRLVPDEHVGGGARAGEPSFSLAGEPSLIARETSLGIQAPEVASWLVHEAREDRGIIALRTEIDGVGAHACGVDPPRNRDGVEAEELVEARAHPNHRRRGRFRAAVRPVSPASELPHSDPPAPVSGAMIGAPRMWVNYPTVGDPRTFTSSGHTVARCSRPRPSIDAIGSSGGCRM